VSALSEYEYHETLYETLYDRIKTMIQRGCVTKKNIRNALDKCYKLFLDRHADTDETFNTLMFMDFIHSLVHEDDWPIFKEVHRQYGLIDRYADNTRDVDETIVPLPLRPRPDWHVPPVQDDVDAPHDDVAMTQSQDAVTTPFPHLASRPSAADANSFVTVQRLDPDKTHKGHVVVSNNGGPRQVVTLGSFHPPPRETAAQIHEPPPALPSMHWETDEPDEDEMEAAWENDGE
jgi:hypothetical protein